VTNDEVADRIARLIAEKILGHQRATPVDRDTPLLSSGLTLDSIAVLELIVEVEREFDVTFRDEELTVDLFRTVGTLARTVNGKLTGRQSVGIDR
jgi:acyl carrier protein